MIWGLFVGEVADFIHYYFFVRFYVTCKNL